MYKYLFVCNENIGRSQIAEGFYNAKADRKSATSAGIVDSSKKYNGRPRPDVIQVMKELEIDISNQEIKQLTNKIIDSAETIVALCDKEMCPPAITSRTNVIYIPVIDPPDKDKTIHVLRNMRDTIKLIVDEL